MKQGIKITIKMLVILTFVLFSYGVTPVGHAGQRQETLEQKINQAIQNDPSLSGAIAGISLRSASSGTILYEHMGDIRLRPASNLKLFTAAAALSALGDQYQFSTELLTNGPIKGNRITKDLFIKGKGDPSLLKSDFETLADQLFHLGVTSIQGDLIGDDSWFDDVRYSVDLPWSDEHTYYGAQVSALTVSPDKDLDTGTVVVTVSPGIKIGQKAMVSTKPKTNYIDIINQTRTVAKDKSEHIEIKREHGANTLLIKGSIPLESNPVQEWIGVWNPTLYALELFKQSLEERGIKLEGNLKQGVTPNKSTLLTSKKSVPLSELLIPFMKLSNNGHAEMLVKEMGRVRKGNGSWEKGLTVLENELQQLGVNTDTLVVRDGSGVSHLNLVPANEVTKLLFNIQREKWFPPFLQSLPVAGYNEKRVGGTLRKRMKEEHFKGKIKAKTGSLTTVSSLSGYIETKRGETIIFSILLNNVMDEEKAKAFEDRLMSILVDNG